MSLRLSILDQSAAASGRGQDATIRQTLALAQKAEAWGYDRFWVSEHHSHPSIVGSAPEVLMAAIAARTQRIRIGSAGVMLPHYAPLKVAEQFRVLDALAPGRIDLGVGRAPGSDGRTAQLLNPDRSASERFPQQVMEMQAWVSGHNLPPGHPGHNVFAYPQSDTAPTVWMLGSSDYGAQLEFSNDATIVQEAMATLRKVYGNSIPNPVDYQITRWASDVFARGSYSYNALGSTPAMRDELARALNNQLFFAGEATARDYFGTAHGAYLSGLRAATELLSS